MPSANRKLYPWELRHTEVAHQNPWFKVTREHLQTAKGAEVDFYVHEAPDSILCVCLTDNNQLILEKQYRPPVRRVSLDYPAGGMIAEDGGDPEVAIRRELREELGFEAHTLRRLGVLDVSPGFSRVKQHVFLARGAVETADQPDPTEDIVRLFVEPEMVMTMIRQGELNCHGCLAATFLAFQELGWLSFEGPRR